MPRTRRTYTPKFKAEAIKLVTEQSYSVTEAAHSFGLRENLMNSGHDLPGAENLLDRQFNPPGAGVSQATRRNRLCLRHHVSDCAPNPTTPCGRGTSIGSGFFRQPAAHP